MEPAGWAAFHEWFGLNRVQSRMLAALYHAEEPMTVEALALAADGAEGGVRSHISRLRQALRAEALDCERGRGYRLTEVGREECRGVLAQMTRELGLGG